MNDSLHNHVCDIGGGYYVSKDNTESEKHTNFSFVESVISISSICKLLIQKS